MDSDFADSTIPQSEAQELAKDKARLKTRVEELEDVISQAIFALDHGRGDDARQKLSEVYEATRSSAHEIYHNDVHALLEVLELGTYARPESPHQVVHSEVLPTIKRMRQALEEISEKAFPAPGPHYIAHIQVLKSTADEALGRSEDGQP